MTEAVAAVDLGATSGRIMLGYVGTGELRLVPVARFPNGPITRPDGLHWDIDSLWQEVRTGLREVARLEPGLRSIGVDTWAVDYGLLSGDRLLATPFHYRDDRGRAGVAAVHRIISPADLYSINGLQHLQFNTLFQLAVDAGVPEADTVLLIPDLIDFWLTGRRIAERTNASTTGLLTVQSGEWDAQLIERLGLPLRIFPGLVDTGTTLGPLLPAIATELGLGPSTVVTAVGSHDTASAVLAVPATGRDFAYISCGTWGLVGVELEAPVITDEARLANFTNESGVGGRVRFLHNVMGLWLISESLRHWGTDDLTGLLDQAAAVDTEVAVFDADDPTFLAPGDMPVRIAAHCRAHCLPVPRTPAEFVRSILESLAATFARTVRIARELSGQSVNAIHIVGGGSQNVLLCQLTADACGLPVFAGPVEATAIGNVLVQAQAVGILPGSIESMRSLVAIAFPPARYLPRP
jgi:rhamnulokinase